LPGLVDLAQDEERAIDLHLGSDLRVLQIFALEQAGDVGGKLEGGEAPGADRPDRGRATQPEASTL
jgi:hypothetical protein